MQLLSRTSPADQPPGRRPGRGPGHLLGPALGTALAYLIAGRLALLLAIPPGYASPLYPAAGIALAAVLTFGVRALPGVALGAAGVNLLLGAERGALPLDGLAVALAIGAGAALQAGLGAALVRRALQGRSLAISEPRDIAALMLLGGAVACLVNSTLATGVLAYIGVVAPEQRLFTAWTWWVGDTLGVLIGTPVALTLIGRPAADWRPRRWTVGLPLLAMTLMLGAATALVARWDEHRAELNFERDAAQAQQQLQALLREAGFALEALRGLFESSDAVSPAELHRAAEAWLDLPVQPQAVGYSERVARADVAAFEARVRRSGLAEYRVFDRADGQGVARDDAEVVALRYVEPFEGNAAALGVNALSVPAARDAILRSVRSDAPAASAGFRLTQRPGEETGVVIYRALFGGTGAPPSPSERERAFKGVVFVTLRMERALALAAERSPAYLHWCLVDLDGTGGAQRLGGEAGCEHGGGAGAGPPQSLRQPLEFAGRHWELRLQAQLADLPDARGWNAWLFSGVGLLAAAMLGALLLTVTGRTRRIEAAVSERTAALQAEMRERQQSEQARRESEQRLRNILDHVMIGVVYADLTGAIRETNPKLCELVGYSAEQLLHRSITELTHDDDRAESAALIARLVAGELPMARGEKRLVRSDGSPVWTRMELSVLRDAAGRPLRLVGVFEDISERLRLQEAERARDSAEAANRAKSEFLSRMSHELRTPLNAMLGFSQLLELDRNPSLSAHQHEWAAQIQQAGWHLLHMINDTLDLSRIESGTLKLDAVPIELAPLLRATVAMIEPAAAQRGLRIEQVLDPQAPRLLGDATRVKQILTNLLSNAVKYNVDGGQIHITAWRASDHEVSLAVRDSGLGMDAQQLAELFQPFNRLGREHSGTEGTGIGLVISRRLAELMGGRLEVRSSAGQGSTFVLTLPRGEAPLRSDGAALAPVDNGVGYRRRLVHYIEDNETNAEVMRGILARRPQVELEVSPNGLDGLAAIRINPPSLILLDMHLPDLDGLELLSHLKSDPSTMGIPVIAVSADATHARIEQAYARGASDYITKPVNVAGFLAMIDRVLSEQDTVFG